MAARQDCQYTHHDQGRRERHRAQPDHRQSLRYQFGKTGAIVDIGSFLNGSALNLAGSCSFSSAVGWTVPYSVNQLSASEVRQAINSNVGGGKLAVN